MKKLATWFEQRLTGKDLDEWTRPPWSRRSLGFGHASDAVFLLDDDACMFILPLLPSDFEPLTATLRKIGATVRVATPSDEKALSKRELAAAPPRRSASKPPKKTTKATANANAKTDAKTKPSASKALPAIPSRAPTVEHLAERWQGALFSTGASLYGWSGADLLSGRNATTLTKLAKLEDEAKVTSLFVDGDEIWVAGNRLWRSTNGGKSFTELTMPPSVDPDFWGKEFHGVARDASGVVWVGGTWVVTVRRGNVVHEKSFGADARIKAVVPTPFGVLLLGFNGLAYLANDGKAQRLPLRGKGHLSAACVTPRGTLIVVGSGAKWSAEIYRSEDGGATFKPVRVAKLAPLNAVAALPDGRLVAGGGTLLLVSTDDGKKWKPVETPSDRVTTFNLSCAHGDAIVGSELQIR